MAVVGGTVAIVGFVTLSGGSLIAIQGFASLCNIGVEAFTGFFAGAAHAGSTAKWAWYIISCGCFAGVYYILWGPLLRLARARSPEIGRVYTRNAAILSVLWLLYPVVFLLDTDGVGVVAPVVAVASYAVLDLLAKVA